MSAPTGDPDEKSAPPKRRRRGFGARTFGLLLCAWIWVLLGVGAFYDNMPAATRAALIHMRIPAMVRGTIWLVIAAFSACMAWSRRGSTIALALLWIPPAANLASYLFAWIVARVPGGLQGYPAGWYAAAFYLGLIGIVVLAAMVPARPAEPPPPALGYGEVDGPITYGPPAVTNGAAL